MNITTKDETIDGKVVSRKWMIEMDDTEVREFVNMQLVPIAMELGIPATFCFLVICAALERKDARVQEIKRIHPVLYHLLEMRMQLDDNPTPFVE